MTRLPSMPQEAETTTFGVASSIRVAKDLEGKSVGVPVFNVPGLSPLEICAKAPEEAKRNGNDVIVYDTAGRIRKGPAPKNLYLMDYKFLTDTKVKIG